MYVVYVLPSESIGKLYIELLISRPHAS